MMEQENKVDLVDVTQVPPEVSVVQVKSVGQTLREGRERLGLSVDDVVAKIKLASRQIVAMEADDFKSLPETAFVRGFVRSYAKLLQLDAQPLLDALPGAERAQVTPELLKVETPFPERSVRQQNLNLLIAAFLLALVIAGFALWQSNSPRPAVEVPVAENTPDTAMVATPLPLPEQLELLDGSGVPVVEASAVAAVPVVSPVSAVAPAPVAPAIVAAPVQAPASTGEMLRVEFDKTSWTEIREKSGKILSKQVNQGGSELRVEGVAPFVLIIGHAGSARLYYKNKLVDLTPFVKPGSDVARLTLE
jgi:cytoskeleton protein RodZ